MRYAVIFCTQGLGGCLFGRHTSSHWPSYTSWASWNIVGRLLIRHMLNVQLPKETVKFLGENVFKLCNISEAARTVSYRWLLYSQSAVTLDCIFSVHLVIHYNTRNADYFLSLVMSWKTPDLTAKCTRLFLGWRHPGNVLANKSKTQPQIMRRYETQMRNSTFDKTQTR